MAETSGDETLDLLVSDLNRDFCERKLETAGQRHGRAAERSFRSLKFLNLVIGALRRLLALQRRPQFANMRVN